MKRGFDILRVLNMRMVLKTLNVPIVNGTQLNSNAVRLGIHIIKGPPVFLRKSGVLVNLVLQWWPYAPKPISVLV